MLHRFDAGGWQTFLWEVQWEVYGKSGLWKARFNPFFHRTETKKASSYISVNCWLSEPKPRFNFVMLVLSLLLAAGALSKMRKSLRDIRPEMKKPLQIHLKAVFSFVPAPAALSHFRAETEIWTRDPFITSEVLYRWAISALCWKSTDCVAVKDGFGRNV